MRLSVVASLAFLTTSLSAPTADSGASSTSTAAPPQSTICGDIVNSGKIIVLAKDAYDCLTSVPFNPAVATRFLKYYNDTLQFQSHTAYIKHPPTSYQQPSSDLFGGLDQIQKDIDTGAFPNQYAFEATLQQLIISAHDAHLNLNAGILSAFTFASVYGIVSVSPDGLQTPKVYVTEDLVELQTTGASWEASAIASINGQFVTDYLTEFAAQNAMGGLEPNSDWNQLMSSSALNITNALSIFEGYTTFYPGENLTFTFENGTDITEPWLAIYNSPGDTGPLETGGDFYNFFVLGFYPASYDPYATATSSDSAPSATSTDTSTSSSDTATPTPTPTSWPDLAYPQDPDVVQPDLGASGVLTGYFLHDISVAVLSIPSFSAYDTAVEDFSNTVTEFIQKAKGAGLTKVLIDLQQNSGGDTLLAYDTFKQFFPTIEPFGGSRMRVHPTADALGTTFTDYYDTQSLNETFYDELSVSDWVVTDRLNADTEQNFTSWGEFFGPYQYNGDFFSSVERYNLSSYIFDIVASGGIVVYGYDNRPATTPQPYAATDIVLLTDSVCSSACALFAEMMHHEAGVRTVVAGGRPSTGPMQAVSGTRGAQFYTSDILDSDISTAIELNETANEVLPPREEDVYITYLTFNLRDQIRKNETIPLQFVYEAANCRIFYTPRTIFNYTALWTYAAAAIFTTPSLCVKDSTTFASNTTVSDLSEPLPGSSLTPTATTQDLTGIVLNTDGTSANPLLFSSQQHDISRGGGSTKPGQACTGSCGPGFTCENIPGCGRQCATICSQFNNPCGGNCRITHSITGARGSVQKVIGEGFCPPPTCASRAAVNRNGATSVPLPPKRNGGGKGKGGGESVEE